MRCIFEAAETIWSVAGESAPLPGSQNELFEAVLREFGPALVRLAGAYEVNPDKRRDLRQDIQFQIWRSLGAFDGRCSLRTWVFRVAHNTAISHVNRERRRGTPLVSLEDLDAEITGRASEPDIDHGRLLARLSELIHKLKPLDRQIMLAYLEELELSAIAEITGLSPANVSMKIHRIRAVLARHFFQEQEHV